MVACRSFHVFSFRNPIRLVKIAPDQYLAEVEWNEGTASKKILLILGIQVVLTNQGNGFCPFKANQQESFSQPKRKKQGHICLNLSPSFFPDVPKQFALGSLFFVGPRRSEVTSWKLTLAMLLTVPVVRGPRSSAEGGGSAQSKEMGWASDGRRHRIGRSVSH